jgi:glycosyltransferase involved in cell wall biosynthesis
MPETVEDGVNGTLVDPGDIHGFSGAISAIFSDKELAQRMGQASLKLARDRFSWERIAELTCSVYREVTGE